MSKHRRVRMTRVDAERLLDTGTGGFEPLAELLAAATPPAASGEVVGERAALAQYRAAHRATARSGRPRAMLKTVITNRAAPKVALAAAAAVAATGGIAVAAVTGSLPGTHHHRNTKHPSQPPTLAAGRSAAPSRSTSASAHNLASASRSPAATHPDTIPSSALRGACRFFQAAAMEGPGRALDNPAFSVLVAVARGKDNVADFCRTLIGPPWTHPTGLWPTPPRHPWPTSHPWPTDSNEPRPTDPNEPWPTEPSHRRPPDHRSHHGKSHPAGAVPTPTASQPPTSSHPTSRPSWPGQP